MYDLIVIGGGPAGVSGALAAGLLGKRVALVEKESLLGGAGINTGTIPSKTLRETALMLSGHRSRRLYGVDLSLRREATVADLMWRERQVTANERDRIQRRLNLRGITQFHGTGEFLDPCTLRIHPRSGDATTIQGRKFLVATGSYPLRPPEFPFEDDRVHDSNEILDLKRLPRKLIVIGSGVIGSEYAGTFAALGTQVHVVDGRDTLLPFLDAEISRALLDAMMANGIRFHWNEKVIKCDVSAAEDVVLTLSSGAVLSGDGVLVCAGRGSNTEGLNLPAAGVTPGRRGIINVNTNFASTDCPHIYAVGDVIGAPALAATGIEQARVAVCHAFDDTRKCDLAPLLPTGIYTIPEASCVGETEASLVEKGIPYLVGRARYRDIPRGEIIGDQVGFLKLLFHRDDQRLLGVHIVGEQATEVIHIGLLAMLANASAELFNRACFNYPTLGDLYKHATYEAILGGGIE